MEVIRRFLNVSTVAVFFALPLLMASANAYADEATSVPMVFADAGKLKMLYDARQRPQTVCLHGQLFVVFNGDAEATDNGKGRAYPKIISYQQRTRSFSKPQRLASKGSTDHHDSPIIWADHANHLHVLFGCHKSPGTHLVSVDPIRSDTKTISWRTGVEIAPKLSYPCVFRMRDGVDLIYYRTDGHTSTWTYRISRDNGESWSGPESDVTDMDAKGRLDWSSYQTKISSRDKGSLHVVYTDYDDNKNQVDPRRFYNPKYDTLVSNEWKYNLSYLNIDVATEKVYNASGDLLKTPVDIDYSKQHCEIWDTQGRGAGVPPAVSLNAVGEPVFLHVLSGQTLKEHHYHFVRKVGESWRTTLVTNSSHQWNSGHLWCGDDGVLHALLVVGNKYIEGGYMDRHGGGVIEEWTSKDNGETWQKYRQVSPSGQQYQGWKFNNVQPVVNADGSLIEGMLLFYGWKDQEKPEARAFLLDESSHRDALNGIGKENDQHEMR
ncbi:BNR repeat-containing protein [bacterium]|nr:BNR repeat-containing protein [bacterium]